MFGKSNFSPCIAGMYLLIRERSRKNQGQDFANSRIFLETTINF